MSAEKSFQLICSEKRQELFCTVADLINEPPQGQVLRLAVDGIDGAGKTTFADELALVLQARGQIVIRASVDAFHNSQAIRYRKGRTSPEGFFQDSYNYPELRKVLLDPLSLNGSGKYRIAIFDHALDSPISAPEMQAAVGSILIFDGIFLHRPELRNYRDFSIFLDVGFDVSFPRMALRDDGSPDPSDIKKFRYIEGQKLYLSECVPSQYATIAINNSDLAAPFIAGNGQI